MIGACSSPEMLIKLWKCLAIFGGATVASFVGRMSTSEPADLELTAMSTSEPADLELTAKALGFEIVGPFGVNAVDKL